MKNVCVIHLGGCFCSFVRSLHLLPIISCRHRHIVYRPGIHLPYFLSLCRETLTFGRLNVQDSVFLFSVGYLYAIHSYIFLYIFLVVVMRCCTRASFLIYCSTNNIHLCFNLLVHSSATHLNWRFSATLIRALCALLHRPSFRLIPKNASFQPCLHVCLLVGCRLLFSPSFNIAKLSFKTNLFIDFFFSFSIRCGWNIRHRTASPTSECYSKIFFEFPQI